ncbi:MAG: hypothetical protein J6U54_19730 [Clostridiales bacterium]|nr:hypothetical protein [Clostridiales bacterium]
MMNVYNSCSNQDAMLEMMSKSDLELQTIKSLVNNDADKARSLFYERARTLGMDEQQIHVYLNNLVNGSL